MVRVKVKLTLASVKRLLAFNPCLRYERAIALGLFPLLKPKSYAVPRLSKTQG
jgi:hypothetical protein